jgi:hypothetical protein
MNMDDQELIQSRECPQCKVLWDENEKLWKAATVEGLDTLRYDLAKTKAELSRTRAEIERLRGLLRSAFELIAHARPGAFENGVKDSSDTIDEGEVIAGRIYEDIRKELDSHAKEEPKP